MKVRLRASLRDYQLEAVKWSLERLNAIIVMPTGSGKTIIAAAWIAEVVNKGLCRKVLVLEPTRILVEQIGEKLSKYLEGLRVETATGAIPREKRRIVYQRSDVVVSTPEAAWEDREEVTTHFDCIIVDECHHTVGFDASAKLLRSHDFRAKLGLTAYVPETRRRELEELIGEVRVWSWRDPRIQPYVPPWIGEVYETPLNEHEMFVLNMLERLAARLQGTDKALVRLAERWFVRDGALALRESIERSERLSRLLSDIAPLLSNPSIRPAHKLEWLVRALEEHDYPKTIVFIDRVCIVEYVESELSRMGIDVVAFVGRRRVDVRRALEAAKLKARVIVSTSAGEEGVDLPEAKMLVIWSNVVSPLRFIQRHGRVRRAVGGGEPRWVVYLVTPDTIDMESFVLSLEYAIKAGVDIPLSEATLEALRRRTIHARILDVISETPMYVDWVSQVTGYARDVIEKSLRYLCRGGSAWYIHTPIGKLWFTLDSLEYLPEQYILGDLVCTAKVTSSSLRRGLRVTGWRDAFKRLEPRLPLDGIVVTLEAPLPGGAYMLRRISYTCRINDARVLEVILRNAFTKLVVYQPSGKSSHVS